MVSCPGRGNDGVPLKVDRSIEALPGFIFAWVSTTSVDLNLHRLNLLIYDYQPLLLAEGDDPCSRCIAEMAGKTKVDVLLGVDEFLETR